MSKQSVELFSEQNITAYEPFRAQLAELKESNEKAVFDYEDEKGNKEARSHIYKLRQTKTAVDRVRKEQKDASLQFGRRVDAQAKTIVIEIEEMIDVHDKPIKAIEQRENDRVANHKANLEAMSTLITEDYSQSTREYLETSLQQLEGHEPDESFEEFTAPALSIWKQIKAKIETALAARIKYDDEQAELERLRAEEAERVQKEREDRIASEAAEKQLIKQIKLYFEYRAAPDLGPDFFTERLEELVMIAPGDHMPDALEVWRKSVDHLEACLLTAEEMADAKQDHEAKEKETADAKAKQDVIDTQARQDKAVKDEADRITKEIEDKRLADEEAEKARAANKKHRREIDNKIIDALEDHAGLTHGDAERVACRINEGLIPKVTIKY